MSHFTVLVVGENPEEQLAPYDENMKVDVYDDGVLSDKEKKKFIDNYTTGQNKTFVELYEEHGYEWNKNSWAIDKHDGLWHKYDTYNPDSKWDWYELGGRWAGYFKLKCGSKEAQDFKPVVDQAQKSKIDFEAMIAEHVQEKAEYFVECMRIIDGREYPGWNDLYEAHKDDINTARNIYNSNEVIKDLKKAGLLPWLSDIKEDLCGGDKKAFLQNAANSALATFAVVKDGKWMSNGDMGWFGPSNNIQTESEWNDTFANLLKEVPDDTLLSLYDCHI